MIEATVIPVGGPSPYDVVVGHGLTTRLPDLFPGAGRALVVVDKTVQELGERARTILADAGVDASVYALPPGEQSKSLDVAKAIWDELGRSRLTRNDAVVAVGGGATTDLAGFVAATWLRGVRVAHLPTTLLAMVDAAVGGKTGINTAAGKNLVGAFHPPVGVLVDIDVLASLPATEWVNGLAEVVKAGFIADPAILDLVDSDPTDAADPRGLQARELIERAIRMKADVVSADFKEAGLREVLNYGHTLAHAIERLENYSVPHGRAVSVGMVFVAELSRLSGRLDAQTAERHRSTLTAVGQTTTYRRDAFDGLLEVMRVDKKARGNTLRFVVLDALAKPAVLEGPDEKLLRAAYDAVSA